MSTEITPLVIHATGIVALGLSVTGSIRRCDHGLRRQNILASVLWACNYALQGASTGAALALISAARNGTSSLVQGHSGLIRTFACTFFAAIALEMAALTWHGWTTLLPVASSLLMTYALFFLSGHRLRWALLVGALLWMETVWSLDAPEPIIANILGIGAAVMGIWRTRLLP